VRFYGRYGKRALDIAGGAVLGVAGAPFMAAAAAVLWRTQGRPILFHQTRVGRGGREFTIVKFRTMVPGAAHHGAGMWFEPDDARVTPAGRWLRASSIDELPQVWNVLRGDMSLVGPRPKPPEIVHRYMSRYRETLHVRPGLTCLAAIEGRNTLRRSQMIDADQRYARDVTLRSDLAILLRTVAVVVLRRGYHAPDESEEWVEDVPADEVAG
jgi:lipopolysaccharide/colanic/teichoic acid biosynthesis glycosyltransferase